MDTINKKICVEKSISRRTGILPFIPFNQACESGSNPFIIVTEDDSNGNFGGFVLNPTLTESGITYEANYCDLIRKYNTIKKILNSGIRVVRKVKNNSVKWVEEMEDGLIPYDYYPVDYNHFLSDGEHTYTNISSEKIPSSVDRIILLNDYETFDNFDDKYYTKCKFIEENFLGILEIPYSYVYYGEKKVIDGDLVPRFLNYTGIVDYINWLNEHKDSDDCCTQKMWARRGGDEMLTYLTLKLESCNEKIQNASSYTNADITKNIPVISLNILLTQNTSAEGVLNPYIDKEDYEDGKYDYTGITSVIDRKISGYTSESRLSELRTGDYFYDDNGNLLPGVFQEFDKEEGNTGCALYAYNGSEWADTSSNFFPDEYNVAEIPQTIPDDADHDLAYLVRYNNSKDYPMLIPYEEHVPKNTTLLMESGSKAVLCGDFIESITYSGSDNYDTILFKYVFGGMYNAKVSVNEDGTTEYIFSDYIEGTGIVYEESYPYTPATSGSTTYTIDGKEQVTIWFNFINIDSMKTSVFNPDFGLSRYTNLSNITEFEKYDEFNHINTIYNCMDVDAYVLSGDNKYFYSSEDIERDKKYGYLADIETFSAHTIGEILSATTSDKYGRTCIICSDGDDLRYLYKEKNVILGDGNVLLAFGLSKMGEVNSLTIKTPMYRPDYLIGITEEVKADVDVEVSRGNASAFEKHFKMTECNTFQDLEEYGNNYFNLSK